MTEDVAGSPRLLSVADAENLSVEDIWQLYRRHISASQVELLGTFGPGRELVDYAEGCYIFLKSGKRVLDLTGGIGVLNHGHNHPVILETRRLFEQRKRMEVHKNYLSPYTAALSANVAAVLPADLEVSFFPNSGSEAVEGAIKMAYKFHGGTRSTVLHADISFHGKLLGAASLTGSPELNFRFPQIPGIDSFGYGDFASLVETVERHRKADGISDVYAIIVEPLNASSMRSLDPDFLIDLRRLCNEEGIILILDEVYTGWGKTGTLFNFMRVENLVPDILVFAKSFGGGKASISGYTARTHIAQQAYDNLTDATLHSTTYYGFGEEVATAISAINIIIDDHLVERSAQIGRSFAPHAMRIGDESRLVADVRGSGALWGFILESSIFESAIARMNQLGLLGRFSDARLGQKLVVGSVVNHLYSAHNILTYFGSNRELPLIISFPLVAQQQEIDLAVEALNETLSRNVVSLAVEFARAKLSGPKAHT